MNWNVVLKFALVLALIGGGAAGYHFYRQDQEFRQLHGRVTPVNVLNWVPEVEDHQDDLPILLYFHAGAQTPEQRDIVNRFAWNNAGKAKVVSIDLERAENLLFAIRFGVLRHPGFAIVYKHSDVRGYNGTISSLEDLQRLLHKALSKQP